MATLHEAVTGREAEVLALLGRRLTNGEIAEALSISVRTVESHVSALLRKYRAQDRRSLARIAAAERSASATKGALPLSTTSFLGRVSELDELSQALAGHRLVTAVGPGGVGKTRLAIQVAAAVSERHTDGPWFVDLARVSDPAGVVPAVAEAVRTPELLVSSPEEALTASLADRAGVLVLDNCEHVPAAVRTCLDLLVGQCPGVTVLATSRTRLMLPYERVYVVPGLSVTRDGGDAVALFLARASGVFGPDAPADTGRVAELCRRLDGIALAIELAAARCATLGLDGLEAGLDDRLRYLAVGNHAGDRHRSLRNAIGWSYDLLDPDDRQLLRGVSVFASWFDVTAAHQVAAPDWDRGAIADALSRLADSSLLLVDQGRRTGYRMLETIRQYATAQLVDEGEREQVRVRHDQRCWAEMSALEVRDPDEAWCSEFDRLVDDVRAALSWRADADGPPPPTAAYAGVLAGLLFLRGRPTEAQQRYEQAAQLTPVLAERAGFRRLAAGASASRYAGNETLRLLREAADAALAAGDRSGAARDLAWGSIVLDRQPGIMAQAHPGNEASALLEEAERVSDGSPEAAAAITTAHAWATDYASPAALELSSRAVEDAGRAHDVVLECAALDFECSVHTARARPRAASSAIERRLHLIDSLPVNALTGYELTDTLQMAADIHTTLGDLTAARDNAIRLASLPFFRDEPLGLGRRILVDALTGAFDDVLLNAERFRSGWERGGRQPAAGLAKVAYAAAMVHGMLGDEEGRSSWRRVTIGLGISTDALETAETGWAPTFDALLDLHRDAPERALGRLDADVDDPDVWVCPAIDWRPWYAALSAEAAVLVRTDDMRERIHRARHAARDNPIASAIIARAAAIADRDPVAVASMSAGFRVMGCPYQESRTHALAQKVATSV